MAPPSDRFLLDNWVDVPSGMTAAAGARRAARIADPQPLSFHAYGQLRHSVWAVRRARRAIVRVWADWRSEAAHRPWAAGPGAERHFWGPAGLADQAPLRLTQPLGAGGVTVPPPPPALRPTQSPAGRADRSW